MRTNVEIDDDLMLQAQAAYGQPTKKATVEEALRLAVRLRRQQDVAKAFGQYDYRSSDRNLVHRERRALLQ